MCVSYIMCLGPQITKVIHTHGPKEVNIQPDPNFILHSPHSNQNISLPCSKTKSLCGQSSKVSSSKFPVELVEP